MSWQDVNGTGLTLEPIEESEVGGSGKIMGVEIRVNNELVELGGLWKVTEGGLVRRS